MVESCFRLASARSFAPFVGALGALLAGGCNPTAQCVGPHDLALFPADTSATLSAACSPYVVSSQVSFAATLTVEPGVTVQFQQGAGLTITGGGALVVNGTTSAPVVFTGASASAGWSNLQFVPSGDNRQPTRLELHHLRLSGGAVVSAGSPPTGALRHAATTPLLLDDVVVLSSAGYGLELRGPLASGSSGVRVEAAAAGVARLTHPALLTLPTVAVGSSLSNSELFVESGSVTTTGTWASQQVPLHLEGGASVTTLDASNVTLTIAGPNRLLVDNDTTFSVGGAQSPDIGTASLVVQTGVTMDCAGSSCTWRGLVFDDHVGASSLTNTVFVHALGGVLQEDTTTFYAGVLSLSDGSTDGRFAFPTFSGLQFQSIPSPPSQGGSTPRVVAVTASTLQMPPSAYQALPMGSYWYHHP